MVATAVPRPRQPESETTTTMIYLVTSDGALAATSGETYVPRWLNEASQCARRLAHVGEFYCADCGDYQDADDVDTDNPTCPDCDVECETCGYRQRSCECCGDCERYPCACPCGECGYRDCRCSDYCHDCGCYECSCSTAIMSYGDNPDAIIWRGATDIETRCGHSYPPAPTSEAYLGLEIEVEAVGCDANDIAETWNASDLGWSKHDGSLSDGVELVSHPTTFERLASSDIARVIGDVNAMGGRAWDPGTCGLHIHVSRKAFADKAHLWRFAAAHQRMSETLQALAGRGNVTYSSWPEYRSDRDLSRDPYGPVQATKVIAGKAYSSERYVAINLLNSGTVELRYWRGTTLAVGVLGAAAVESALFYWTRDLSVRDIASGRMTWERFLAWAQANRPAEYEAILALADLRARRLRNTGRALCA